MLNNNNTKESLCINWHVTEICNYHCKGCFAKWNQPNEVWHNHHKVEHVIENINEHYGLWQNWRLNIVGGEPILQPELLWNVVEIAHKHGAKVSS